ncbi:MAG: YjbQ family protein [Balneolaceae bacterium]|nr:YjbQ family protein [Balneolaceae bacterium]MCH8548385.1 secondary thiamine-phosphate synthase enzyme YjbQ [Balneolaceae bacterium]
MITVQKEITLSAKPRGFHLITREVLEKFPEIQSIKTGVAHIFIQHTSAGLTINENADPSVRRDFESHFSRMVPEDESLFKHTLEGPDDMTSHIKSSLLGHSVTVPVTNGSFNLGTWQGIYLCEHRNRGGIRRLVITVTGE